MKPGDTLTIAATNAVNPRTSCVCGGSGKLKLDTTEACEGLWNAGDIVTAECPYCDAPSTDEISIPTVVIA